MVKNCKLLDQSLKETDIEIIFGSVKTSNSETISF